ncbi:AraC family transcriptional regulator [Pseudoduganella rivuli]|nr:AraC family transcriptional regulator [Pseudoduganella rivuli]
MMKVQIKTKNNDKQDGETLKPDELFIPARYYAALFDHLESQGIPCRDALSAAQIRTLNDPQARLTVTQAETLMIEAARLTGRRDLGFEMGRLIKLNSHDILGYAIISCPTMDHVLRLASRYYKLMTPLFAMRYSRHPTHAEVTFRPVQGMPQSVYETYMEVLPVAFHCQLQAVTQGRQPTYDIYLTTAAPPHALRYRELRNVRIHFGVAEQPGMRVMLDTSELDVPLAMTDLRVLQQAEARCKQMLQHMDQQGNWCDWVSMMLREAEDAQPTLEELAGILNVSSRTLDRHLAKGGVSFRELSLRIRNERACELLASGKYPVSQIAYRLGYTDIANFSRSFRKLNGVSPTAWVEQHQAFSPSAESAPPG